jgi:hypothetical protein
MDAILGVFSDVHRDGRVGATPAARLQRASGEVLAALSIGALWGAAAGSVSARLAAANLYKVPMVMLLSELSALPLGLLAWKALAREQDATSFLVAHAKAMLGGALVLGAFAPLVALYSHTSAVAGPVIAVASVAVGLSTAIVILAHAMLRGAEAEARKPRIAVVALCAVVQFAAALQLNVLAAPILPVPTAFRGGVDGLGALRGGAP